MNYDDVSSFGWVLQTAPATANFAGGTVNGQVLQVVPEPSSFALALAIAGLAAAGYRRRSGHRLFQRPSPGKQFPSNPSQMQ